MPPAAPRAPTGSGGASTPAWSWAGLVTLTATAVVTAIALGPGLRPDTTYAGASSTAFGATALTGVLLGAAAAYVAARRMPRSAVAVLLVAVAAWSGPVWAGWAQGPPLVRSLGDVLAPLLVPALVHLAVAGPTCRPRTTVSRRALTVVWVVAVAGVSLRAAVRDPVLDPGCWSNCSDAVFLLHAAPALATAVDVAGRWAVVATAIVLLVLGARRPVDAVRAAATLAVLVQAAEATALITGRGESSVAQPFQALFLARATAVGLVAIALLRWLLDRDAVSAALSRLVAELGRAPAPGAFEAWLARALDDDAVTVLYRHDSSGAAGNAGIEAERGEHPSGIGVTWVDTEGRRAAPFPGAGQEALVLRHRGEAVALVLHRRGRESGDLLRGPLRAAAGLVVGAERLRAVRLAGLRELEESRTRIVEAADDARRRLERDLHDGAQQRLLAAGYRLRLAAGHGGPARELAELAGEVDDVTRELREIAHGIYSTAVDEAGLAAALESLADTAPVPVEVACADVQVPPAVARAVHLLVEAAVTAPVPEDGDGSAPCVEVVVRTQNGVLEVDVNGVATVDWTSSADRFGALGGVLVARPGRVHAEVPCG